MTALGEFGSPPDTAAWCALALAPIAALAAHRASLVGALLARTRVVVLALAVLAGALSALYVVFYLRGGPRIIDATSYWLEARSFAGGHVAFPVPSPSGSFRGRFLLSSDDARALSVIFPPGYPAVLALGFLAGAPLAVGPLLALLLVLATAEVARRIFDDDRVTLLAAALSSLCAVLRYHTADTMSHGLAALLLTTVVGAVLRASVRSYLLAGLAAGLLFATRPASGLVAFALVAFEGRRAPRLLLTAFAGALFPCALFFVHQRAATGDASTSTQFAYYALADGPPGCFRYGFGADIGCRFEHGDFVAARLARGFGPLEALLTTLRRLKMHLADAGNVELFAPLVLYAASRALRDARARLAGMAFFGLVAAYVPFYFDGNYPGGGARFFADGLPLEHVLLASLLVRLRAARFALPLALAGFALHTSYDHRALSLREGGAPMFDPRELAARSVSHGLVFVGTDHGFNLGHAPAVRDAARGVVVARNRGDAHDLLLWEALGRPQAYDYVFSPSSPAASGRERERARLTPRTFTPRDAPLRFEAESEWPPLAVSGGSAYPDFPACASAGRALALRPSPGRTLNARIEVTAPRAARYRIGTGWFAPSGACRDAIVTAGGVSWTPVVPSSEDLPCRADGGPAVDLGVGQNFVVISAASECELDFVELHPIRGSGGPPAAVPPP